jgi:hypothetical protein
MENDDDKEKRKKRRSKSKLKREQLVESWSRRCSSNPDLEVGEKTTHREHKEHRARFELEKSSGKRIPAARKSAVKGRRSNP